VHEARAMSTPSIHPDDLAQKVLDLLAEHGAALHSIDFETYNGGSFGGRHNYSCFTMTDYLAGKIVSHFERA